MTLPSAPEGLPPLPKGLRGALALQSGWKDLDKVHALKTAIQKDLQGNGEDLDKNKTLQGSLTQLRQDMVSLRQLDLSLLCQLLRLYENIQDWKQMMGDQSSSSDTYDYGTYNGMMGRLSHGAIYEGGDYNKGVNEPRETPEKTKDEPIYENTPATRPSFWHTRRKNRTDRDLSRSPARSLSRSPALDNPDFDESMLGPTSTPRRLSKQHQVDLSGVPRYIARTQTGSNGLGASETLAWLASGSPYKTSGSVSSQTSSSNASLDKSFGGTHNMSSSAISASPLIKSQYTTQFHSQSCNNGQSNSCHCIPLNRTSTPAFNESHNTDCWSPVRRQGSVSTESDESLYLEPLPCLHAEHQREHHKKSWKQNNSPTYQNASPTYQNCSGMSGYERQLSANSSYLYESTC